MSWWFNFSLWSFIPETHGDQTVPVTFSLIGQKSGSDAINMWRLIKFVPQKCKLFPVICVWSWQSCVTSSLSSADEPQVTFRGCRRLCGRLWVWRRPCGSLWRWNRSLTWRQHTLLQRSVCNEISRWEQVNGHVSELQRPRDVISQLKLNTDFFI